MLKILFLILTVTFSIQANNSEQKKLLYGKNTPTGCTIPFFSKQQTSCSTQSSEVPQKIESNKKEISKSNISTTTKKILETQKVQLVKFLRKVKKYKQQTKAEKLKLQKELTEAKKELIRIKKEFKAYKLAKKRELSKLNSKLKKVKQKKKKIAQKKPKKDIVLHKVITPIKPNTSWIEVNVDKNTNIYDLALKYYGDSQEYEKIYMANQNKINQNYQIENGISLKIPITKNFMEQPMLLNID